MKYSLGYQIRDDEHNTLKLATEYSNDVYEVYFAWPGMSSGREPVGRNENGVAWGAQARIETDLLGLKQNGTALNLLMNASCFGDHAISLHLEREIRSLLDYLEERIGGIDSVTTLSPFVARVVKKDRPEIAVRASVNMNVSGIESMKLLADVFDGFYLPRERQRNLEYVSHASKWCRENGKHLCMLVNSGCLYACPSHIFHINLVAHHAAICDMKVPDDWNWRLCWTHYEQTRDPLSFLRSTWIRPEDLGRYEKLIDVVKIASRQHYFPGWLLQAYSSRRWNGNMADLTEPGFSKLFLPLIIDNKRFPEDWFRRTSTCTHQCHECDYCEKTLEKVYCAR